MENSTDAANRASLEAARSIVRSITDSIFSLLVARDSAMQNIAQAKSGDDSHSIFKPQQELDLLSEIKDKAAEFGLNAMFAESVLWLIMSGAKFTQQDILDRDTVFEGPRPSDDDLLASLIELTCSTSETYDAEYGGSCDSVLTRKVIEDEQHEIEKFLHIIPTSSHGLAFDIGSGTGQTALFLARSFKEVIGYDISHHMVKTAHHIDSTNYASFIHADVMNYEFTELADFVCVNFGTASELQGNVFDVLDRCLKPGGYAFLSFHNSDTVLGTHWQPLPSAFTSIPNHIQNTLYIALKNTIHEVHCRFYNWDEITSLAEIHGYAIMHSWSFPTLASVVPTVSLQHEDVLRELLLMTDLIEKIYPFMLHIFALLFISHIPLFDFVCSPYVAILLLLLLFVPTHFSL